MNVKIPESPSVDEIRAELGTLKKRAAKLRALLRYAESRELADKLYGPPVRRAPEEKRCRP